MKTLSKAKLVLFASAIVLLLLTSCAVEGGGNNPNSMPTAAEVEQYNASVAPSERIACRNERPVGSYIPVRVCFRVSDMRRVSDLQRDELRRVLR
ncbi:MAG: hypothetical protein GKR91_17160 [Pseudomonadales bacterium]|nr:hypothetical protein [Pseudomonadales bacterium]